MAGGEIQLKIGLSTEIVDDEHQTSNNDTQFTVVGDAAAQEVSSYPRNPHTRDEPTGMETVSVD